MATVVVTINAGGEAGSLIRELAQRLDDASSSLPDRNPSGSAVTVTFDNAPATGTVGVSIAGGSLANTVSFVV